MEFPCCKWGSKPLHASPLAQYFGIPHSFPLMAPSEIRRADLTMQQKTTPMMRSWRATRWNNNIEERHKGSENIAIYYHPIATLLQNHLNGYCHWLWHRLAPCPSFHIVSKCRNYLDHGVRTQAALGHHVCRKKAGRRMKRRTGRGLVWTPGDFPEK